MALGTWEGSVRLFFSSGNELECLTATGTGCEGFPFPLGDRALLVGAPALGDVNRDGRQEIAAALSDGRLILIDLEGKPVAGFAFTAEEGLQAGPSLVDLDGDGRAEILIGTKSGKHHALRANGTELDHFPVSNGEAVTSSIAAGLIGAKPRMAFASGNEDGRVYVSNLSGQILPGFPCPSQYLVSGEPALGDIDADGFNDVAFASQDFKIYAVRHDGELFQGFPVPTGARMLAGPALADLEEDGKLEVVAGTNDGRVFAIDASGQPVKGFPVKLGERITGAVVVADLDRDGKEEILAATVDGQLHVLKSNGKPFPGFPARLAAEPVAGPVVGDSGDGTLLVAVPAGEKIFAFKIKRSGKAAGPLAWPQPGHDGAHTGRVHPNPPGYADLKIVPASPTTDEDLKAEYRFFDLDGDPQPPAEIRWFRDRKEVPELSGKLQVPKELTRKKEKWRFQVSTKGATPRQSEDVIVVNTPPGQPRIAFEPAELRRAHPLKVRIEEPAQDMDGDEIAYRYAWLRDGKPLKGLNGPELPAGTLTKAERWTVVVTAFDGECEGRPVFLQGFVVDSAPSAPQVALTPAAPRAGDPIQVVIKREATDVDGDRLRYRHRFSIDGKPLSLASTVATLPALSVQEKQVISVEVRADDGEMLGPPVTAQVSAVNTPPEPPKPTILPVEPKATDTLFGALASPSSDIDGDPLTYRFTFWREGKKIATSTDGREVSGLKKGEVYELEVVANDGEADSAPGRVRVTVKNSRPTLPAISFSNTSLRSGEAVEVRIDRPSTDADADPLSYEYAFSVNGKPADLPKSARGIPPGRLRKHESWTVEVTPFDREETGPTARAQLAVINTLPTRPMVEIEPAEPTAESGARVRIVSPAVDRDADPLSYRYAWSVDGEPLRLPNTAVSVAPGALKRGESLRLAVTAFDGEAESEPAWAEARVKNSPPTPPRMALQPERPTVRDELVCAIKKPSQDPDRETPALRYTWRRNGVMLPLSARQDRIAAGIARHGEIWSCEVIATDGELSSPALMAQVSILNSPPAAPMVAIEPEAPRAGQDLVCRISKPSEDADLDSVSYAYRWTQGGKPLASDGQEPWRLAASALRKGQSYRCDVTPSDAQSTGTVGAAESRLRNSPPTRPSVHLAPKTPVAGAPLACEIDRQSTDPDGESVRYRYKWLKNGVEQSFAASSAQVPARLSKENDLWRCMVTPHDGEDDGPLAESEDVVIQASPTHRADLID
jgi:outer membrane protein assembly factor BamB